MKIYIITFSHTSNVGAALQEYALYKFLKIKGYDVKVVDYIPKTIRKEQSVWENVIGSKNLLQLLKGIIVIPLKIVRKKKFYYFSQKYIELTSVCKNSLDIEKLEQPDIYLVGSDQVWNIELVGTDPGFFLQFKSTARKAAYAASAGEDRFSREFKEKLKANTKDFFAISVREKVLQQTLNDLGDNFVHQVLDPVFLLSKKQYQIILQKPKLEKYVLIYEVEHDKRCITLAKKLAKYYNLKVVQINRIQNKFHFEKIYPCVSPTEFLGLVQNADYIVTNSFHAVAFSLIFEKQFWVIKLKERFSRLESILEIAKLKDRVLDNNDVDIERKIDFHIVKKNLEFKKKESEDFLETVLNEKVFEKDLKHTGGANCSI
ncbi:MAG: polysaccharide pyruvyl transferase family protein [Lachnospiraceae bacterium]|nr:polysaccharide pyruvyl transferase family protein [Lachnospiraceae bacterium]